MVETRVGSVVKRCLAEVETGEREEKGISLSIFFSIYEFVIKFLLIASELGKIS